MSEPATKKQKRHATKCRGGRKKVSMDPIDPSTNIFEVYNSWEEVPYELQCIPENAREALKRRWIWEVEWAPQAVQQNKDLIRESIIQSQKEHQWIARDKPVTCPKLIKKFSVKLPVHKADWKDLPDEWKQDSQVAMAALQCRRANWKDIPESLRSQDDFARKAVVERPDIFPEMPDRIRNDKEHWLSDHIAYNHVLYKHLLEIHPDLRESRPFWLKVVQSKANNSPGDLFEQYASPSIRQDQEIMLAGCIEHSHFFLATLSPPFSQDEDFVRQVLQGIKGSPYSYQMANVPMETQRLFPHLVIEYMFPEPEKCVGLPYFIDPTLWSNMEFTKAWLKHGGSYPKEDFPEAWSSDPDLFLWIAKECPISNRLQSFQCASETLRSDKAFLLEALELDPLLFEAATPELKSDIELQQFVCSKVSDKDELAKLGIDGIAVQQICES